MRRVEMFTSGRIHSISSWNITSARTVRQAFLSFVFARMPFLKIGYKAISHSHSCRLRRLHQRTGSVSDISNLRQLHGRGQGPAGVQNVTGDVCPILHFVLQFGSSSTTVL